MADPAAPASTDLQAAVEPDALWYKDAVIYELHVRSFFDSNDDGIGDFAGLAAKLDYIQELGVNTIWLLPFYPSPLRDDGYDISDYRGINPQYGSDEDFRRFVREAQRRGLRLITELVVNHTSSDHPWFQAARRAPAGSSKRNFYVWSDDPHKYAGTRVIFNDTEQSNWAWDSVAKAYYWHRFFGHQPDLNFGNPHVVRAMMRAMRYWLDQGVSGLRLDAVPYLCEREGSRNENLRETHLVVQELRRMLDARYNDRMLLAEANLWPEDARDYFAEGNECHMAYHFPLMPRMYMAIAQEDRHPIVEILEQTPEIPPRCQWAIFLRNHDELTLEMVTSKERDYMYRTYAADARARLNLGIRRRLAPLLDNDPDRIKLMNSLLLSMPGSPIIYYGDEIGMGDNFFLGDRNGVRTPMQWSPDRNAGFSRADPQRLFLPPIMDPIYGYESVNVEAQSRDRSSLLHWMRRMLAVRKSSQAFGRGTLQFLKPGNRKVLAYLRTQGEDVILCVANLARSAQAVELDLASLKGHVPTELLGRTTFPPIGDLPYLLTLQGHGFFWFRLSKEAPPPDWHELHLPREELPLLVLFDGWASFFRDQVVPWRIGLAEKLRARLETEVVPHFLLSQRWYAAKDGRIARAVMEDHGLVCIAGGQALLAFFRIEGTDSPSERYFLPLALAWEDQRPEATQTGRLAAGAIARVRQQASIGILADAFADPTFCQLVMDAIGTGREITLESSRLHGVATKAFSALRRDPAEALVASAAPTQGSNTTVMLGDRLLLKVYRRVRAGTSLELEIGRYLTETARFTHIAPLAGALEYAPSQGEAGTLALLFGFVRNQGDAWEHTVSYLHRFLEETHATPAAVPADVHAGYLTLVRTLGQRTAELHLALGAATEDPAFAPEHITSQDLDRWRESVEHEAQQTFQLLDHNLESLPQQARGDAQALLARRDDMLRQIRRFRPSKAAGLKIRHHGDYHLSQTLLTANDVIIIDFEGEPSRPLEERRRKHSPLRDVVGMLRSFDYARYAAVERAAPSPTRPAEPTAPLLLADWLHEAREAFLSAYRKRLGDSPLIGADPQPLRDLLELEKVLYEIRYELASRPAWLHVPVRGALELCATAGKPE